jgi:copper transport protein
VRRLALVALVALVAGAVLVLGAAPASAHATLEATSPADRAHLDKVPPAVSLTFSEDVSASLGAVKVVDGSGTRVDSGDVVVNGHTVSLGLRGDLGDGAYIVTYRVISADSHPVRGAFTFTVGNVTEASAGAVSAALDDSADRTHDLVAGFLRAFAYGGALLAAGGALFLVVAHDGGEERRLLVRIVTAAAVVGALAVVAGIPVQAALATGLGLRAVTESGVLGDVLADGVGLATVATLAGLAVVVVAVRRGGRSARVATLAGAAFAAGGFALSGHTTESSPRAVAYPADVVHVLAAAAWLGGLLLLSVVLVARRDGDAVATGRVVARFSRVATIAVLVVATAGIALALVEVRTVDALTSTRYGWVLVAKVAVALVIGLAGAYNHYRLVPALEQAPKKAGERLRTTVRAESGLMVAVVALTAWLVTITPANAGGSGVQSITKALEGGSVRGSVNLVVDPARVGLNSIHLYLLDESGRALGAQSVELDLSLPSAELGPIDRTTVLAGPGHFQLDGGDLSVAGEWTIVVKARIDRFTEETATVKVDVSR